MYHLFPTGTPGDSLSCYETTMCNLWIYPWEINKDKLRNHTDVQSLNLTASGIPKVSFYGSSCRAACTFTLL